ncbi:carboxypeptidase M32 [Magnetospirillum fulvum]|uniref:Metal-dependent carboxypeptidase n=1 Tax=Magnetospirillum fulvum MGU-K5 TaxID=1316936 RepID=S9SDU3_MAGFU|nr:carboxypeptidase M32 [Magnetospirillum fulvum]EPY02223.1 thermostable carboxypeptidase 1 [Magnetospirillum fulvum MGU-K5]
MTSAYAQLEARFHKASVIGDALSILHWDMATMMPDGSAESRAEQFAVLRGLHHQIMAAPDLPDLLDAAEGETLEGWERANLAEMRRDWVHAAALPADLVEAVTRAEAACEMVWREARAAADFAQVLPSLKTVLSLAREVGAVKAERLGVGLYDALLDQYEPGGRAAAIDPVFDHLEGFLPGFIAEVLEAQRRNPPPAPPPGPFPIERQRALGLDMMTRLGFDFTRGRLDISHHPFCGGHADDTRITTRYDEADFSSALMGVIHETGHSLYEFGLPGGRWRHQPVARARGMVMHESQSLLFEMQVARSRAFADFAAPAIRAAFDVAGPAWEAEALYRRGIKVEPGFIRVDADEVTYPAHVIIRYRLERALIEGRMELEDLPAAWNEGYRRLLGITPPNDRLGCLQDIHWYSGSWGYFPTYTLGAMTAAQLFDAARRAIPGLTDALAQGDIRPLLDWLRAEIHGKGSSLSTSDLMIAATGRPLDPALFEAHLRGRYLG